MKHSLLSRLFSEKKAPARVEPPVKQPWFATTSFNRLLKESSLSEEEKAFVRDFADNGYVIFDPEINDVTSVADRLRNELPYPEENGRPWFRIQDYWDQHECVRELAILPKVLQALELLYQREPIPFQTLNFPVGTQQQTHSDIIHFSTLPERWMCGVWIALEDIDETNGPLHYYPGSHKLPLYSMHDFGISPKDYVSLRDSYPLYEQALGQMIADSGLERKTVTMKKGQALIWESNLLHGGEPIKDFERTRLTQVTHYYFGGCSYYGPLQSDLPLGRVAWRKVRDIRTGKEIAQYYNGERVAVPDFDGSSQMLGIE